MLLVLIGAVGAVSLVPLVLMRKSRHVRPSARTADGVPRAASSWRGGSGRSGN